VSQAGHPRFGMRIPPCAPVPAVADCAVSAESAGFDTVWIPDSQFLFRDVWMSLAAVAAATRTVTLGPCVTNVQTRQVTVTANAVQTLEELAPGRTVLGIGTGDSSVKALGLPPSSRAEVRRALETIRRLGAGEPVASDGPAMRLRGATGRTPSIYLAATGPKVLQLAGEIGDGVLMMAGVAPDLLGAALQHVDVGLATADRSRRELDVCLGAVCCLTDSDAETADIVRPHCVGDAQRGALSAFAAAGVTLSGPVPQVIPDVYPDITHAEEWGRAAEVARRWVDDEAAHRYAEAFTLVGTVDQVVGRIEAAVAAGVTSFYLRHHRSYSLPDDLIDAFGSSVIPRLASR